MAETGAGQLTAPLQGEHKKKKAHKSVDAKLAELEQQAAEATQRIAARIAAAKTKIQTMAAHKEAQRKEKEAARAKKAEAAKTPGGRTPSAFSADVAHANAQIKHALTSAKRKHEALTEAVSAGTLPAHHLAKETGKLRAELEDELKAAHQTLKKGRKRNPAPREMHEAAALDGGRQRSKSSHSDRHRAKSRQKSRSESRLADDY